jgi:hypothetical protein
MLVFMPTLLTCFRDAEKKSGTPLTLEAAQKIRATAVAFLANDEMALKIEYRRGFRDLDPIAFWDEWRALRGAN